MALLFIYVLQLADVERLEDELESYNREELHIREFVLMSENTIVHNGQIKPQVFGVKVHDERPFADIVAQYDWHYEVAMAVMREESSYNPNAINREGHRGCNGSYGLYQVACVHFGKYGINWDNWNDPEVNIRAAYLIYKEQGFRPWGVCVPPNQKVVCWL